MSSRKANPGIKITLNNLRLFPDGNSCHITQPFPMALVVSGPSADLLLTRLQTHFCTEQIAGYFLSEVLVVPTHQVIRTQPSDINDPALAYNQNPSGAELPSGYPAQRLAFDVYPLVQAKGGREQSGRMHTKLHHCHMQTE